MATTSKPTANKAKLSKTAKTNVAAAAASAKNAMVPQTTKTSGKSAGMKADLLNQAAPILNQRAPEIQKYGERFHVPIGLAGETIAASITVLNQVLADTLCLRDLYKKHHWQVSGATFYQLHLLLDKHYEEQAELVDMVAERIQALGGIAIAMPHDVAEMTKIERPPRGREEVPVQLSRLLEAHETILKECRAGAKKAADKGDDGTNDLLVSNLIRTNEAQVWFISEHLVSLPIVRVDANDNH